MGVSALGYVGFEVSDLAAWRRYATEFLGLMYVSTADDLRFRTDSRAWRIAALKGSRDDLAFLGLEFPDAAALAAVAAQLKAIDIDARLDKDLARQRGVNEVLTCTDPSGVPVEIYT